MTQYPDLETLVGEVADLRPLSSVALRIIELSESERFSAHELATVIASDQALTAKLLRLANSAYYGFARRITTVRDAVVLLGFRAVRSTTLVACVIDTSHGSKSGAANLDYEAFWRFSVSTGMIAEVLGRAEGTQQDHAFTAGVLHNIGRLALDEHLPEAFAECMRRSSDMGEHLHESQRAILGFSDAELGARLAERWSFPRELVDAVQYHAAPPHEASTHGGLTAFVARARLLAVSYGLPDGLFAHPAADLPEEWTHPPLSVALRREGGLEGLLERTEAFLETALPA